MEKSLNKKKMQDVHFKSIGEFLDFLPEEELKLVEFLREMILECIPNVKEKLSFNVPFYSRYATICFIWPGSVPWGEATKKGVRFGFTSGYLLEDSERYLDKNNRKQIYTKDFFRIQDVDTKILKAYLIEALMIDEEKEKRKKK